MTARRSGAGPQPLGRRGSVTIVVALVSLVLIGFVGFAVDATRAWRVSARLKASVDAAAMMAARRIDADTRDTEARDLFWLNFRRNLPAGNNFMGANITNLQVTQLDVNRVQVTGTASLETSPFSRLFAELMQVRETSVAQRQVSGYEIALALDLAGSVDGEGASGGGAGRLAAIQAGTGRLLDIVYGTGNTRPNTWVALVPFTRAINIGTDNTALLNENGMPPGWSRNAWAGCVEARTTGNRDLTDDAPTTPATRFRPFYWPSTYRQVGTVQQGRCVDADSYPPQPGDGATRYCFGDNDWGAPPNLLDLNPSAAALRGRGLDRSDSAGPNLLCNAAPMRPLTASRSAVQQAVDGLTAPPTSGGRTMAAGLQGAWYVLSPNWRGSWQDPNGGTGPALPLAYNTRGLRKAVILVSTGAEDWLPSTAYSPRVRGTQANNSNEQFYGAYGRAGNWNGGGQTPRVTPGDRAGGRAAMGNRFTEVCAAMKSQGIMIYVLGVEVPNAAARSLLQGCATGAETYFESAGTADLERGFAQLGNALARQRLAE